MGTHGCQQRMEIYSVFTAESLIKQTGTNSSQVVGVTVKNFNPEPSIELWWNDAKKPRRLVDANGQNQSPKQAETTK